MILTQLYGTKFKREKWLLELPQHVENETLFKGLFLFVMNSQKKKRKELKPEMIIWKYKFLLSSGFVKESGRTDMKIMPL